MTVSGLRLNSKNPPTEATPAPASRQVELLADILLRQGQCDSVTIDRGRRVAAESGQRLDQVLLQLGLVTERGLAEGYATLLGVPLAGPARYPEAPVLPERLSPRFLRTARACPLAIEDGALTLAVADALDEFSPAAIAAATGLGVRLEIAVPIELEAAFGRLYPEGEAAETAGGGDSGEALEEDAERLKDLASEAPVIRLVNQLIGRAVETHASDIHIEPFEDRLRVRYRYDGVLHEADGQPARLAPAIISRRMGAPSWPCAAPKSTSVFPPRPRSTAKSLCCACSIAAPWCSTTKSSACRKTWCANGRGRSICPTASCSSPAPPAAAKPPRSTPFCAK
jgi:general secretion pathway protein E